MVVGVEDDVVVNVHQSARPLAEIEWFGRQRIAQKTPALMWLALRVYHKAAYENEWSLPPFSSLGVNGYRPVMWSLVHKGIPCPMQFSERCVGQRLIHATLLRNHA